MHESLSKAATEFLDEHGQTVDTAQFNIHHPETAKPGENGQNEGEEMKEVSEFLVEQLHSILNTVDGRYVRPLSIGLPKRNVNGQKFSEAELAAAANNQHLLGRKNVAPIAPVNLPPVTFNFTADGQAVALSATPSKQGNEIQTQTSNVAQTTAVAAAKEKLNTSRVILIQHALNYTEGVTQPEEFTDVIDDMEMGCGEYAKPINANIVKPEHCKRLQEHGIDWVQPGWVFCQFRNEEDSAKVFAEMQDGDYDGQILKLSYYEQDRYVALLPLLLA